MIYILHYTLYKYHPVDLYGQSGISGKLWAGCINRTWPRSFINFKILLNSSQTFTLYITSIMKLPHLCVHLLHLIQKVMSWCWYLYKTYFYISKTMLMMNCKSHFIRHHTFSIAVPPPGLQLILNMVLFIQHEVWHEDYAKIKWNDLS